MDRLKGFPGLGLVLVLVALACAPALWNDYAYDDRQVVMPRLESGAPNPMVFAVRGLGEYFATEYWTGAGATQNSAPLYRPITVLSFALFGGVEMQHALSILIHLLNTVLVFLLARWIFGCDSWAPCLAALAFGLMAVHAEAITAIVGRADLLAFGFGAAATWCALRETLALRVAAVLLLFLAFCSKESAVGWWPTLVLVAWCAERSIKVSALLGIVPFAAWWWLRSAALADLPEVGVAWISNPLFELGFFERIPAALGVWGFSLWKTLVPIGLVSDYGAGAVPSIGFAAVWLAAVAAGLWALRKSRRIAVAIGVWLALSLVTSNLLVPIGTTFGERLAYLPSLGVALGLAATSQRAALISILLWCALNGGLLFERITDWRDDATLFTTDAATQPGSLSLQLQAAIQAWRKGDFATWERHLRAAIEQQPDWARPYIELAGGLVERTRREPDNDAQLKALVAALPEAEKLLRRALDAKRIEPGERRMLWRNLAFVRLRQGDEKEAWSWFEKIPRSNVVDVRIRHEALIQAANAFSDERFLQILSDGETLQPDEPYWAMHRGLWYARRGEWLQAQTRLEALPQIRELDAFIQNAWIVFGEVRAKAGDRDRAHALFERIAADPRFLPRYRQAAELRCR